MKREPRDRRLNVRIGASDEQRLRELAERDGVDVSDVVRCAIARAHREAFTSGEARRA